MDPQLDQLQAALPKRYTLLEELDRGGLSRVYRAREELPDREVVIKAFDEELSARLGHQSFVSEVEQSSRLVHPHIVSVNDLFESPAGRYYTMEFVDGVSLDEWVGTKHELNNADQRAFRRRWMQTTIDTRNVS